MRVPKYRFLNMRTFKYPRPSKTQGPPKPEGLAPEDNEEELTGYVNGQKASNLEERFARALRELELEFVFQHNLYLPGREYKNTVDFLVRNFPLMQPIEIYGQFAHDNETARQRDEIREAELNEVFAEMEWQPLLTVWYWEIATPDEARRKAEEIFF